MLFVSSQVSDQFAGIVKSNALHDIHVMVVKFSKSVPWRRTLIREDDPPGIFQEEEVLGRVLSDEAGKNTMLSWGFFLNFLLGSCPVSLSDRHCQIAFFRGHRRALNNRPLSFGGGSQRVAPAPLNSGSKI